MKRLGKVMSSARSKWIVGIIAFALVAWGYSYKEYPDNIILMTVGGLLLFALLFDLFVSAPRRRRKNKTSTSRNEYANPSTVQGGSNYGQGSSYLSGNAYKQGSTRSAGSNYDNEKGFRSE